MTAEELGWYPCNLGLRHFPNISWMEFLEWSFNSRKAFPETRFDLMTLNHKVSCHGYFEL